MSRISREPFRSPEARVEADRLLVQYRDALLNDTLPFWLNHAVDAEHGGIMTCLNRDGSIVDTDKGVWQQGRFCWLLGELYNNVDRCDAWLHIAESTARFLQQHCVDSGDGRMWFHVTRSGRPLRKRRYSFSESFAAIAYGELALATGRTEYRDLAVRAFEQFQRHSTDDDPVLAKFTSERPLKSIGVPMISLVTAQELRQSIGLTSADQTVDQCIAEICDDFMKPELEVVMESVAPDGSIVDHFDGRTLNPGHAIEAAWFILREADLRNDEDLVQIGCRILDWMWARGWDREYGGLSYFVDLHGLPVQEYWHDMKFWWPHNEAAIATLYAWLLTGNDRYLNWHRQVSEWSQNHFADAEHGEWFGYVHRDGRLSSPLKGNLWKGPFHLPRMQYTCWQILEASLQSSDAADAHC